MNDLKRKFLFIDGLGQLTDGILGNDDYRLIDNVQGISKIGYNWIGWKRKSTSMSSVNLNFHFDTTRNFTAIHIHTSNLYTRDVYLFHSIIINSCEKKNLKHNQKIHLIIPNDYVNKSARFIHISLIERKFFIISDCLNITLIYNNRSKWLLISEIQFDSVPIEIYIPELTTLINQIHEDSNVTDENPSNVQYPTWIFFVLSSIIFIVSSFIYVYIRWNCSSSYEQEHKLFK